METPASLVPWRLRRALTTIPGPSSIEEEGRRDPLLGFVTASGSVPGTRLPRGQHSKLAS